MREYVVGLNRVCGVLGLRFRVDLQLGFLKDAG